MFALVSGVQQSDSATQKYIYFLRLFPLIGYYGTLSMIPCAIQ